MAIRMRRGNEADFDPSKMLPGEWAVSTDTKYVRMCFSPGIVLRMATYEAFESDMAEIRKILSECQSIQTAVEMIQQNVTASELVIENYVKEAKQYRDEAEQFRNEASMFAPEGYEDLVKNVSDNTVKIDTIIEKAELNIKNNTRGSNIHLTDSAESNVVSLELYGKTEQNAYTGKNLLDCRGLTVKSSKGVDYTPVYDNNGNLLYVNANGTATSQSTYSLSSQTENDAEKDLYVSGCLDGDGGTHSICISYYDENASWENESYQTYGSIAIDKKYPIYSLAILIRKDTTVNNVKFYPMISEEVGEYEPYVGSKPSPSPSYPQEIKSVKGKNLLDCRGLTEKTDNGGTFTPVKDENGNLLYVEVKGTFTNVTNYVIASLNDLKTNYTNLIGKDIILSGTSGDIEVNWQGLTTDGIGATSGIVGDFTTRTNENSNRIRIVVGANKTVNEKIYPMIRLASITDDTYVPYGLLRINTQGKNFVDDTDITSWYKPANSRVYRKVFKLKPNTEYTISQIKDSDSGSTLIFAISGIDLDFTPSTSENGCTVGNSRTVTSNINGYITIGLYENSKGYCQLEEGSTATEYQPYQSTEITLSEPIELNGFNGVYDVVTSDGVTRRFAEVVFDGSDDEGWNITSVSNGSRFYIKLNDAKASANVLCTQATISNCGISASLNFYIDVFSQYSSVAELKTHLVENPMTVVYELATPTTEELQSDFTALKTFYPETYVSNDADCDMSITYTADAKNYIDNKIALLTTAIYNNI